MLQVPTRVRQNKKIDYIRYIPQSFCSSFKLAHTNCKYSRLACKRPCQGSRQPFSFIGPFIVILCFVSKEPMKSVAKHKERPQQRITIYGPMSKHDVGRLLISLAWSLTGKPRVSTMWCEILRHRSYGMKQASVGTKWAGVSPLYNSCQHSPGIHIYSKLWNRWHTMATPIKT
jgi:hypothetical protein